MATPQETLEQMYDAIDGQVEQYEAQIAQVEGLRDEFIAEKEALRDAVMTPAANQLKNYLQTTKAQEVGAIWGGDVNVNFGSTYNNTTPDSNIYTATLTDWVIVDATNAETLYEYGGVGWDADTTVVLLIQQWNFCQDYLTKPLTDLQGNYGILANISNLGIAIDQLEYSKQKVEDSGDVFEDYV
jgi:hypothetical protein